MRAHPSLTRPYPVVKKRKKQEQKNGTLWLIVGWAVVLAGIFIAVYFVSQAKPRTRLVCDPNRNYTLTTFGTCRSEPDK